jgi:hypothetical protein
MSGKENFKSLHLRFINIEKVRYPDIDADIIPYLTQHLKDKWASFDETTRQFHIEQRKNLMFLDLNLHQYVRLDSGILKNWGKMTAEEKQKALDDLKSVKIEADCALHCTLCDLGEGQDHLTEQIHKLYSINTILFQNSQTLDNYNIVQAEENKNSYTLMKNMMEEIVKLNKRIGEIQVLSDDDKKSLQMLKDGVVLTKSEYDYLLTKEKCPSKDFTTQFPDVKTTELKSNVGDITKFGELLKIKMSSSDDN